MAGPLQILYPNGLVLAVQVFIEDPILGPIPWDGSGGGGGGGAVTIANGADVAEGNKTDVAWTGTGDGTVISLLKAIASAPPGAVTNDGTFATPALQTAGNASLASIDAKLTNPLPVSGPLTDAQLRAAPVPVSGTLVVSTISGTVIVSGTISTIGTITGTVGVSGTVQANAGTNLNTSLLALEAGGNLASIKAKTDNLDVLLSTRLKPADTLAAITVLGSITNPVTVNGTLSTIGTITNPVTVVQPVGTSLHVNVDNSPSITNDGTFATPTRQDTGNASLALAVSTLASILANQIVPLGGPQAIAQNAYWVTHRLDEQNLIEAMKAVVAETINNESATSQRMGFELR